MCPGGVVGEKPFARQVTTTTETIPDGCASVGGSLPGPECYDWDDSDEVTFYVAQVGGDLQGLSGKAGDF